MQVVVVVVVCLINYKKPAAVVVAVANNKHCCHIGLFVSLLLQLQRALSSKQFHSFVNGGGGGHLSSLKRDARPASSMWLLPCVAGAVVCLFVSLSVCLVVKQNY